VSDVADRPIVVVATEERDRCKSLAHTEDVACGSLSHELCHRSVFDPYALAAVRVGCSSPCATPTASRSTRTRSTGGHSETHQQT